MTTTLQSAPAADGTQTRPTVSCRFHCAACGRHFLSLRGFDRHRSGPWEARVCLEPADDTETFRPITAEGLCKLNGGAIARGETIWGLAGVDSSRLAALKARATADHQDAG